MHKPKSAVDKDLFDIQFERFRQHVLKESGSELVSL